QLGLGRTSLTIAVSDLRRLLGLVNERFELQGVLTITAPPAELGALTQTAIAQRPDLQARQAALGEADARLRLEIANRFGNPNVGPAYEYDPARVNLIGAQITLPLPVFNRHRGEIMQRQAERGRVAAELWQTEVQVRQDVAAALTRLDQARGWAN